MTDEPLEDDELPDLEFSDDAVELMKRMGLQQGDGVEVNQDGSVSLFESGAWEPEEVHRMVFYCGAGSTGALDAVDPGDGETSNFPFLLLAKGRRDDWTAGHSPADVIAKARADGILHGPVVSDFDKIMVLMSDPQTALQVAIGALATHFGLEAAKLAVTNPLSSHVLKMGFDMMHKEDDE